jgi:hypothetical protein
MSEKIKLEKELAVQDLLDRLTVMEMRLQERGDVLMDGPGVGRGMMNIPEWVPGGLVQRNHPFEIIAGSGLQAQVSKGAVLGFTQGVNGPGAEAFEEDDLNVQYGMVVRNTDVLTMADNATNWIYAEVVMLLVSQRTAQISGVNGYDTDTTKWFYPFVSAQSVVAGLDFASYTSAQSQLDGYNPYSPNYNETGTARFLIGNVTTLGGVITLIEQFIDRDIYNNYAGVPYILLTS